MHIRCWVLNNEYIFYCLANCRYLNCVCYFFPSGLFIIIYDLNSHPTPDDPYSMTIHTHTILFSFVITALISDFRSFTWHCRDINHHQQASTQLRLTRGQMNALHVVLKKSSSIKSIEGKRFVNSSAEARSHIELIYNCFLDSKK